MGRDDRFIKSRSCVGTILAKRCVDWGNGGRHVYIRFFSGLVVSLAGAYEGEMMERCNKESKETRRKAAGVGGDGLCPRQGTLKLQYFTVPIAIGLWRAGLGKTWSGCEQEKESERAGENERIRER